MKDRLVPWLRDQVDSFPELLRIPVSENVAIVHRLHSISMTGSHIDFRLQNSIAWDDDVIEGEPVDYTHFAFAGMSL
uniref:AraC family transcriptional regulator n=1 Tax=Steinernema glaseri TaxID=37863 RepID=A0A1I8AI90_9BILA